LKTQTKRKKGEIKMADKRKNTGEEFFNCCEGMPFAEMMQKMRDQESGCCDSD